MNRKLAIKFIVPTAALVFAAFAVTGYVAKSMLERVIRAQAERVMADSIRHVTDSLAVVHELSSQQSRAAITIFSSMVRSAGDVSVKGKSKAIGDELPDLMIGKESVVGKYGLVDKVNGLTGATATIFVKRGTDFVRVSTNVKKDDGSRAVGTVLDPNGKAIANLRQGIEFNGVVDILGSPYMTTYVPLRNGSDIIGALYVGFPLKSLSGLNSTIYDQKILEHGHIAVIDGKGKIRFASTNADQNVVASQLQGNKDGWNVVKSDFAPWGYTLIAAYPESDVANAVSALKISLLLFSLTAASLMVAAQFWLVKRCVVKPVGMIVAHLKDVAEGEGDLTKRIAVNTHDELSDLAGWFNQFMERLEGIIAQVAASTEKISSASEEISASAMQVAEASEHQKDQTHQVATAMAEMHSTVMQVSENSSRAAETAQHAGELAHGGGEVVEETISVIRQVAESTRETAAKIEHLGKSSDQIGKIIGVIDDIADQTNLLALNAAIEAARAGDQGRGFAVVADEVRKLAERTTGATKEIAQMISAIQVETSKAVEAMEVGTKRVDAGVQTAQKAGDALRDIIESSEHVHNLVTHIATASAQQATATDHINVNMEQIADMVQSASTGAQESAQACVGLSDLAMQLQGLVNRFKIREQQRLVPESHVGENALVSRNSNAVHASWVQ